MERPPLPDDWESKIPRTSTRPSKIMWPGVPMAVLCTALLVSTWIWLALDTSPWRILDMQGSKPWAAGAFLLIVIPAAYATKRDPWWLGIIWIRMKSWRARVVATRGACLGRSSYRAPR